MSLKDGSKKMSKSNGTEASRIHLSDTPEQIRAKIRSAKSDSIAGITYDPVARPEIANLLTIYAALNNSSVCSARPINCSKSASDSRDGDVVRLLLLFGLL
jgi:tryptophanyl-tRNA synthetase